MSKRIDLEKELRWHLIRGIAVFFFWMGLTFLIVMGIYNYIIAQALDLYATNVIGERLGNILWFVIILVWFISTIVTYAITKLFAKPATKELLQIGRFGLQALKGEIEELLEEIEDDKKRK